MDISGTHKIKAPRPQVFSALLNPEVLKNSIPGCETAKIVDTPDGQQLKLRVSPDLPIPGLKGPFVIFLKTGEVVAPSRVVLITEPSNSMGSVKAVCTVNLSDDPEGTNLTYNAHAELSGKIAATPELLIKPAIKGALEKFFKNFEKQTSTVTA